MVPWIAILVGGLFVWLAVTIGFYETWCLFVNILISIYAGVYLAPAVLTLAPSTGDMAPYGTAMSMVVVAGGCFALLYGISYVFLTGQFSVPFPKVFDVLLAGVLGFLTGFLLLSFLALAFTTTPVAQRGTVSRLGFNADSQKANIACLTQCCDVIHALTGGETVPQPTKTAITQLLDRATPVEPADPVDPNAPIVPSEEPAPKYTPQRPGWMVGPNEST